MEGGKKSPVVDLGEQRWARIEQRLFERVSNGEAEPSAMARSEAGPRRRGATALVLAAAAAAICGGVAWRVRGDARGADSGAVASRIATEATASHVTVGEATLEVGPRSVVSVSGDDTKGVTVVLVRGRVECDVPPRRGRPPFSVQAGEVSVRVVGTHFAVSRTETDVDVDVQHGVVAVTSSGKETAVHEGERWPEAAHVADAADSGAPLPPAAVVSAAPGAIAPISLAPPPSPRELYEAASRLEAQRPDLAVVRYQALAAKGGPWGMNALFAAGRLESERGHLTESRRLLEDYLRRYPAGPNAGDARQLLERLR